MYLPKVIRFNAVEPAATERYAKIARYLHLEGKTTEELVAALVDHINELNVKLDIPSRIKDYEGGIIDEKEFMEKLPKVGACRRRRLHRFQPASHHARADGRAAQELLLRQGSRKDSQIDTGREKENSSPTGIS